MADTVKFVDLPHDNARRIAYMELGCVDGTAQRSLLAIHGFLSCRLCAMPGIKEETLRDYKVRFIAIDRPGYGLSDPDLKQTFRSTATDIEAVMDALHLGKKVWLLGFSMGGAFCWAAARYIPDRIAGMALWAPVGNLRWKGLSKIEREAMMASYSMLEKLFWGVAQWLPAVMFRWYARCLSRRFLRGPQLSKKGLSSEDWACIQRPQVATLMIRSAQESFRYFNGLGAAKDLQLLSGNWGFDIEELSESLQHAKVDIWQGDRDKLVPLKIQNWIEKRLPTIVTLHELHGEGHFSWSCCNDHAHRLTLATMFEEESISRNED